MKYTAIIALLTLLSMTSSAQGYGFKAEAIAGLAAAQIRGDELAGYNQPGLEAGLGVSYGIRHNMDLAAELLFSQRGSRSDFFSTSIVSYRLNYAAVPILFYLHDWLYEDESGYSYFKVNLHGGVAYGRLLSASVESPFLTSPATELEDAFNSDDVSWILGGGLQINYRLGVKIRYNRSITPVIRRDDHPDINVSDFVPYHLSLHLTYQL